MRKSLIASIVFVVGCCAPQRDASVLADSYRRFINGPGQAWLDYSQADERLDQSDVRDRAARLDAASALVDSYEREPKN